jgi:hypothetical protein
LSCTAHTTATATGIRGTRSSDARRTAGTTPANASDASSGTTLATTATTGYCATDTKSGAKEKTIVIAVASSTASRP